MQSCDAEFPFLTSFLGPSGIAFVEEALRADHELTIYARNPSKLPENVQKDSNVKIIKGTFDDMDSASQALHTGATALVSFAGPGMPAKGTVTNHPACRSVEGTDGLHSQLPNSTRDCSLSSGKTTPPVFGVV